MIYQYYSAENAEQLLQKPGTLAVIQHNSECSPPESPGLIPIGLQSLCDYTNEVISINSPVTRGRHGRCQWSASEDMMCVATWISPSSWNDIEVATEASYHELLAVLRNSDFTHPVRFWNFIPAINQGGGDTEAYKRFCLGRLKAFRRHDYACEQFPAASALGHHGKGAVIYALATRETGRHFENPNQQQAYRYPRQYGPASPSFSRATQVQAENRVFISGTASILGHETRAVGDFAEQLKTTLANIGRLCEHIGAPTEPLEAVRVYLRHKRDYIACREYLQRHLPDSEIIYTLADICREKLLVEIEAAYRTAA